MFEWKEEVNISHIYRLYEKGDISLTNLAKAIANKLKDTKYFSQDYPEYLEIIVELEDFDDLYDMDDFIAAMNFLYDFGDDEYKLWIETIEDDNPKLDETNNDTTLINELLKKYNIDINSLSFETLEWLLDIEDAVHLEWVLKNWKSFSIPSRHKEILNYKRDKAIEKFLTRGSSNILYW